MCWPLARPAARPLTDLPYPEPSDVKNDPVIEVSNLRFAWNAKAPDVLDLPELTVHRGEQVFIKGPSGSGKTTLLNLLGGLIKPGSGSINVLGQNLGALGGAARDRFRARHIGFVFQMFNLIPYLSLVDNTLLPCRFSPQRKAKALAGSASLEDEARRLLRHLELDLERLEHEPVTKLSMGQQQRVAVARALIGQPELIIADEPTSALDQDARDRFLDLLFQEAQDAGATVLFVSHDATLAHRFARHLSLTDINRAGSRQEALA